MESIIYGVINKEFGPGKWKTLFRLWVYRRKGGKWGLITNAALDTLKKHDPEVEYELAFHLGEWVEVSKDLTVKTKRPKSVDKVKIDPADAANFFVGVKE